MKVACRGFGNSAAKAGGWKKLLYRPAAWLCYPVFHMRSCLVNWSRCFTPFVLFQFYLRRSVAQIRSARESGTNTHTNTHIQRCEMWGHKVQTLTLGCKHTRSLQMNHKLYSRGKYADTHAHYRVSMALGDFSLTSIHFLKIITTTCLTLMLALGLTKSLHHKI